MQRLDHSYLMRTSDCPSLKRKPSEYMREMFYSSQPMEMPDDKSILEATFKMINAETQLVWSSDYPHWDFDLPGVDLRSAVPEREGEAQHPGRQCGPAVQPRHEAGEEYSRRCMNDPSRAPTKNGRALPGRLHDRSRLLFRSDPISVGSWPHPPPWPSARSRWRYGRGIPAATSPRVRRRLFRARREFSCRSSPCALRRSACR